MTDTHSGGDAVGGDPVVLFVPTRREAAMLEADERFLDRLRTEIEPIVGRRTALGAVGLERGGDSAPVRLVVELVDPTGTFEVRSDGDTLIEAIGALPARIAEARLAAAFREVVRGTPR